MAKLKRISTSDVTLGMFIHKFEGGWMSHPFWRAGFLLENGQDLHEIHKSDIAAVWIDEDKSLPKNPIARKNTDAATDVEIALRLRAARTSPTYRSSRHCRIQEDRSSAIQTMTRAKQIVRQVFDCARMGRAVRSADVVSVVRDISQSLTRNRSMLIGISRLKSKDEYTYLHSVAVCALMVNLAREIGLDEAAAREAGMAGLLHDVGKMAISDGILNKPGRLTEDEFQEIQEHTTRGHRMLLNGSGIPDAALDVCLNHHEKIDGTGYPRALPGEQISLMARMGAICDVYDAMTSRRAYKAPMTPSDTITLMHTAKGHFDPELLFHFMRSVGTFPTGMLVRLKSDQLGVIVQNGRRGFRTRVKAFYDIACNAPVDPYEIVINDAAPKDEIANEEQPGDWPLHDWPSLREMLLFSGDQALAQAA